MTRRPRPRTERLLSARVLARVYGWVGIWEGVAGLSAFLVTFWLAGWRPGDPLPDEGALYVQATGMTMLGIVMGQVGAGLAMRTSVRSVFSIGVLSNRFLLAGIASELLIAYALVSFPPFNDLFHTEPIDRRHWLFLAVWPPVVLLAEEARKAVVRRRNRDA
jgi:magnesium-transporting ATPase (P-type)